MFKLFFIILTFAITAIAEPYKHLTPKESKKLFTESQRICKSIKTYAEKEQIDALKKIHDRHCVQSPEPLPTGILIGLYHLEIDTPEDTQQNKAHKYFYKQQLTKLSILVKRYPDFQTPPPLFNLARNITELSGFTRVNTTGTVWSHGDSGTAAAIAQTNIASKKTQTFQMAGSQNFDWEAIVNDGTNIWVLDVGDNKAVRKSIALYKFKAADAQNGRVESVSRYELTYPDGAMDCEASVYHEGAIYLFQKKYYEGSKVYRILLNDGIPQNPVFIGKFPVAGPITDATINDKKELFILTYFGVYEVQNWLKPNEAKLRTVSSHVWGQTEAIVHISDDLFWVGREDGNVYELRDSPKQVSL